MKQFVLLATIVAMSLAAFAQVTFTIKAGGQSSNWRGDGMYLLNNLVDLGGDYLKQGSLTSFYAGTSVNIPLSEHFAVEPGIQYSKVGTTFTGNLVFKALSLFGVNAGARVLTKRLEMPVLVKAEVAKGLYVVGGPQVNYAFSNKLQIRAGVLGINAINQKFDISNGFEPLSAAALGGLQYNFGNSMQLQALYEYGLSKITNNGTVDIHQNSIRLGLGIAINHNRSKEGYYY